MATIRALVAVAAMTVLIELSMAANHTVGQPGGSWDLQTNLSSWVATQTFAPRDNLIFLYDKTSHSVLEVTKANFDSCTTSSPIKTYTSGDDVISLPSATTRYFICGKPFHCNPGNMKIQVNIAGSPSTPTPPASSSPPPSSPGKTPSTPPTSSSPPTSSPGATPPPSTTTPPPPPGSSGANGLQAKTAVGFGIGAGVALLLAL